MHRMKKLAALGLAGALTLAVATPSIARDGHVAAAAAGGFAAGAVVGSAAAADANAAYYNDYAYEPGYASEPGYVYEQAPAYGYGDMQVGATGSGSPVYRSQLTPYCTLGLKQQDRC